MMMMMTMVIFLFNYASAACPGAGKCGSPKSYLGDKMCDDNNNNCGCNWDNGDCCGSTGEVRQFSYCKECKCKNPKFKVEGCPGAKVCNTPKYVNDNMCDDDNNVCGCNWDEGDCCESTSTPHPRQFAYCKLCLCIDPKHRVQGCPGKKTCGSPQSIHDKRCDDDNNNCGCSWDKGDCCGPSGDNHQWEYCEECKCKDPESQIAGCPGAKKCVHAKFESDENCDDENNNCGCNWDGGDCCGSADKFGYCKECKCKDPDKIVPGCPGKKDCTNAKYKGDGRCDDNNNNCHCSWDGGDCCGNSGTDHQFAYCKECKCKDPQNQIGGCPGKKQCVFPNYKRDGKCDDKNNVCGCAWDGGDCCDSTDNPRQFTYCDECKCKDPDKNVVGCPKKVQCGARNYKNDGRCDDNNNNCACNWDGGDCCGSSGADHQFSYCVICKCRDPEQANIRNCKGKKGCKFAKYRSDGKCDDENNNCGCNWDGGDCCGSSGNIHQLAYCTKCKCLDPDHSGEDGENVVIVHGRQ